MTNLDRRPLDSIKATVVMACLNEAATLDEALESLVRQEADFPWEILFADNGSTDGSREVFEAAARRNPHVCMRYLDASARAGKAHALNMAIPEARGDSLLFLDADDSVAPGWLAAMAAALDQHPFVEARMDFGTLNTDEVRRVRAPNRLQEAPLRYGHAPWCTHAGGATLGFRRFVFDALGGFDPDFGSLEDDDFCARAYEHGFRLFFVPRAVYNYRFRSDLRGIRTQAFGYAKYAALLRERHDPATRRRSAITLAQAWLRLQNARLAAWKARPHRRGYVVAGKAALRLGTAEGDWAGARQFRVSPKPIVWLGEHGRIRTLWRRAIGRSLGPAFPTITGARTTAKAIALTFDDGPDPQTTPVLLDLLAELGAKATFFLVGASAARHPDLVARIAAEGHEIGSHTWDHPSLPNLGASEAEAQIGRAHALLSAYGARFFRPPYGDQTLRDNRLARRAGARVAGWTVAGGDWMWDDGQTIADRVLHAVEPGSIVLLHDRLNSMEDLSARPRDATFEAVRRIVTSLPDYQFVTLTGLLALGQPVERCVLKRTPLEKERTLYRADDFPDRPKAVKVDAEAAISA